MNSSDLEPKSRKYIQIKTKKICTKVKTEDSKIKEGSRINERTKKHWQRFAELHEVNEYVENNKTWKY